MAGPLLLLASPLAIVAYCMLASALSSYIALRFIRTWGLVGRLVATFSRKEALPITASSTPSTETPSTSWRKRARTRYIEWIANLIARFKTPLLKLPHLPYQRIEFSVKADEGVELEEAREAKPKAPPPLVDLGESSSPMLGVYPNSSNVSACPTPELSYRHLPSPIPWRPGTTPPLTTSSRYTVDSPPLPMTPPPTFASLSPFASPRKSMKGKERESFELRTFSQPLIQFSPVASPRPRPIYPHDRPRTPSPVHNNPYFLSTSPSPTPLHPRRRTRSLGGATVKKVPSRPSFELFVEETSGKEGEGGFGQSGLLIDLGRADELVEMPVENLIVKSLSVQMEGREVLTPTKSEASSDFVVVSPIQPSAKLEAGVLAESPKVLTTCLLEEEVLERKKGTSFDAGHHVREGLLFGAGKEGESRAIFVEPAEKEDSVSSLGSLEEEFGLFDNPFNSNSEQHSMELGLDLSPSVLDTPWHFQHSDLASTPVVVDLTDDIPSAEDSKDTNQGHRGPDLLLVEHGSEQAKADSPAEDSSDVKLPSSSQDMAIGEDVEDIVPDPEDLPLPCVPLPRDRGAIGATMEDEYPDPPLPEIIVSFENHGSALIDLLQVLASVEDKVIPDHAAYSPRLVQAEPAVDTQTPSSPPSPPTLGRSSILLNAGDIGTTLEEVYPATETPSLGEEDSDLQLCAGSEDRIDDSTSSSAQPPATVTSIAVSDSSITELSQSAEKVVGQEPSEPILGLLDEPEAPQGQSPTPASEVISNSSLVSSSSSGVAVTSTSKPRHRAVSDGLSAAIASLRRKPSPLDVALAMQMRPGLGAGADPAFMVRFLMAAFSWFVIVVNGGIDEL